jgi:hypothetical protein
MEKDEEMASQPEMSSLKVRARIFRPIFCLYPKCHMEFTPGRRGQRFHSEECRKNFFALARSVGAKFLSDLHDELFTIK